MTAGPPATHAGREPAEPVTLIVDAANVVGSRADGWWRDRAGATVRLHDELARLAAHGIPGPPPPVTPAGARYEDPPTEPGDPDGRWFPQVILVVEGRARVAADRVTEAPSVQVVAARGEGDDTIAGLAESVPGRRIVITADRELSRRCRAAGADVTGPRWLTRLLA